MSPGDWLRFQAAGLGLPLLFSPCCEICWHFWQRFGGASLLPKEKFEIPLLEKHVPPGSGFLAGDSTLLGIQLGSHMEKPVREGGRKSPVPVIHCCFTVRLNGSPWVFTETPFLFGQLPLATQEAPSQALGGGVSLFNHLGGETVST